MGRFSLKRLPSPGLAVGVVALIAALSGTAIALPGKNTVDSGDIKPQAVKTQDLAPDSVTFVELANNAANGPAFLDSAVASKQLDDATQADSGAATPIDPNDSATAIALCPNDGQAVSGGFNAGSDVVVSESRIYGTGHGWVVKARAGAGGGSFTTLVNCLD
jgi:hypothetical protein